MSTKREPLLSDEYLGTLAPDPDWPDGPEWYPSAAQVRNIYEAARAKDLELIQRLVDAMYALRKSVRRAPYNTLLGFDNALDAATAQGFKPSEQ